MILSSSFRLLLRNRSPGSSSVVCENHTDVYRLYLHKRQQTWNIIIKKDKLSIEDNATDVDDVNNFGDAERKAKKTDTNSKRK